MNIPIKTPKITEDTTDLTINNPLKGDSVKVPFCQLENEKVTIEFPAKVSSVLEILIEEGEKLEVGTVFCVIETTDK